MSFLQFFFLSGFLMLSSSNTSRASVVDTLTPSIYSYTHEENAVVASLRTKMPLDLSADLKEKLRGQIGQFDEFFKFLDRTKGEGLIKSSHVLNSYLIYIYMLASFKRSGINEDVWTFARMYLKKYAAYSAALPKNSFFSSDGHKNNLIFTFTEKFGYLTHMIDTNADTIELLPYGIKNGNVIMLNNESYRDDTVTAFTFFWDATKKEIEARAGYGLTISNVGKKEYAETLNVLAGVKGQFQSDKKLYSNGYVKALECNGININATHITSLSHLVLGSSAPKLRKGESKAYFIPAPETEEEFENVYDAVMDGLVDDYRASKVEREQQEILEFLVNLGESTRLLENIPTPIKPEEMLDAEWNKRQGHLRQKNKGKQSPEEKIRSKIHNIQAELLSAMSSSSRTSAIEDAESGSGASEVAAAVVAVAPEASTVTAPSAEEIRIKAIWQEIEDANKKAREVRAARRAATVSVSVGGGEKGGASASSASASAAGAGAASSSLEEVMSELPTQGRVRFDRVVAILKNAAKKLGKSFRLDTNTGSSHFRIDAGGEATTLVRKHGGDTSVPIRVVSGILLKLFGSTSSSTK